MSIGNYPTQRPPWTGEERRHGPDEMYTGPERRQRSDAAEAPRQITEADLHALHIIRRFEAIEGRLDRGSDRMRSIELELRENTTTTREVRDLLEIGRSGFKVLGWFGKAVKWFGGLAAAGGALWTAIYMATHGGKPPGA